MSTAALAEALTQLRDALAAVRLPLGLPGSEAAGKGARDMVTQLDDYILPRLATLDAPLLTVIGGSTGAGKSTLVNSLVGRVVSRPGVIRPTTKSPVLVHHPDDLDFFQSERILPGLGRTFDQAHDTSMLQLVAEPSLPPGLALLDAPDIDSVVAENRAWPPSCSPRPTSGCSSPPPPATPTPCRGSTCAPPPTAPPPSPSCSTASRPPRWARSRRTWAA